MQGSAGHGPTQLVIPGEQVPQPLRRPQHPLSKRYARKHLSTRCATARLRRPPAPRAEAATFAREGDETILSACGAPNAGEATGQPSTAQEVAELLLDKSRKPLAVSQWRGVRTEGLEMVPYDPVQDDRYRIARFVCARWTAPRTAHRRPTCQHREPVNPAWMPRSRQRGRDPDNRGCHRVQIDSSAGGVTGHFSACMFDPQADAHATAVTVLARRLSREQPEGPLSTAAGNRVLTHAFR
jgi:hypothetical protein